MTPEESVLSVRRSIHVRASPVQVWAQFADIGRMGRWWGQVAGVPTAGADQGQHLITYEPRLGGSVIMEIEMDGRPVRYGGAIRTLDPARELTFENDWMPNMGWATPTFLTLRLTPALGGTHVELFHHGFERTGPDGGEEHVGYEAGWGMTQLKALKEVAEAEATA